MRPFPTSRFPLRSVGKAHRGLTNAVRKSRRLRLARPPQKSATTGPKRAVFRTSLPIFSSSLPPSSSPPARSLTRVRTHSRQTFFVFHLHPFTTHPNLLMHNAFRVKTLPSPFPSLGFTGRPVFSPRPCPPSHAFDASPPQSAKGEGKKTKTFTPNARSLNKLRKVGKAVKAKNENRWTRARARETCFPSRFPR